MSGGTGTHWVALLRAVTITVRGFVERTEGLCGLDNILPSQVGSMDMLNMVYSETIKSRCFLSIVNSNYAI